MGKDREFVPVRYPIGYGGYAERGLMWTQHRKRTYPRLSRNRHLLRVVRTNLGVTLEFVRCPSTEGIKQRKRRQPVKASGAI